MNIIMSNNAVNVQNLEKKYKHFTLGPLSLEIPRGVVMGLVGANGAGKSTLIKLLLGAAAPTAGQITVLDGKPGDQAGHQRIGVVFDDLTVPNTLSSSQLGKIMAGMYAAWDEDAYQKLLVQLELTNPRQSIKDYSRGMRMKLSIALAMSHKAELLLLDEPTGGLDPLVRSQILDLLRAFMQDESHSILISSHITSDLERIADYIAYIDRGRLLLVEEKDQLMEQYGLVKLRKEQLEKVDSKLLLGLREESYGYSALTADCGKLKRICPDGVIDRVGLDDIMEYIVREARK